MLHVFVVYSISVAVDEEPKRFDEAVVVDAGAAPKALEEPPNGFLLALSAEA